MYPSKGTRRAIKSELLRQGLQARPDQIIEALAEQGIIVDLDAIQRVRVELLKNQGDIKAEDFSKKQDKRKARSQKIPEKRPQRR